MQASLSSSPSLSIKAAGNMETIWPTIPPLILLFHLVYFSNFNFVSLKKQFAYMFQNQNALKSHILRNLPSTCGSVPSPLSCPLSSVPGSGCSIALMGALPVLHDTEQIHADLFSISPTILILHSSNVYSHPYHIKGQTAQEINDISFIRYDKHACMHAC